MDTIADSLNVYINDPQSTKISLSYILGLIREIATIAAIIGGLFLGQKGIKKYLLEDLIKSRVNRIHNANEKVFEVSNEIISEISDQANVKRIIKKEDISQINKLTKRLQMSSSGSSYQVETLAFFLHESTRNISISSKSGETIEKKVVSDFFNLIHNTCIVINEYAGTIVELPNNIKTIEYSDINKSVRKYLDDTEYKVFEDIKTGVTLNPNSAIANKFYDLIRNNSDKYSFSKRFFQTLQNNNPVLIRLFLNEIYFPLVLEQKKESILFGKQKLHLVNFRRFEEIFKDGEETKDSFSYKFYYCNLNPIVGFVESIKDETALKKDYRDDFLNNSSSCFGDSIEKFKNLGDETVVVTCSEEAVKKYYKHQEKSIKSMLDSIRKKNKHA